MREGGKIAENHHDGQDDRVDADRVGPETLL